MSNVITLTKVLLKNFFRNDKKTRIPTYFILSAILIPCLGIPIFTGVQYLASAYVDYGISPFSLISLILPLGTIFIIVSSIFSIISNYYLSSDIERLLPLPFKPWEIILAKFFSSLSFVYLMVLALLLPILLGIGAGGNANFIYYLYTIIITIIFPLFPVAFISIIITSLMKFSTKSKSKDKFSYLVSLFAIVFSLALSFGSNILVENMMNNTEQTINNLQQLIDSLGNILLSVFFMLYPAYFALTHTTSILSLLYIIIYIAIAIGSIFLFALIAKKVYLLGIMGAKPSKSKKNKYTNNAYKYKAKGQFKTLIIKEIKSIIRSPSYNMNLLLVEILMPFILIISFVVSYSTGSDESGTTILNFIQNINLKNNLSMGIVIFVSSIFASMSLASPTSFSREGKNALLLKSIPVSTSLLIHSKMFFGVVTSIIVYLVMFLGATLLGFLPILDFIFLTISVIPFTILMNYIGIIIDVKHPKLNWDDENVPVKQNINGVIFMFASWICGGVIAVLGIFVPLNGYIYSSIIGIICLICCIIINIYIKNKDIELLNKI